MTKMSRPTQLWRIVACAILVSCAADLWPTETSADSEQMSADCAFSLPPIEQNRQYILQLRNLTLFKDCQIEGSYLYYQRWYSERLPWRRFGSRGIAVLVIVLGAILPILVIWRKTEAHYRMIVAVVGALIVIAQGVSQTLALETVWGNFMRAHMRLTAAHDVWQHEMIKASLTSANDSLSRMEAATDAFAKQVSDTVLDESNAFFTAVKEAASERNAAKPVTGQ